MADAKAVDAQMGVEKGIPSCRWPCRRQLIYEQLA